MMVRMVRSADRDFQLAFAKQVAQVARDMLANARLANQFPTSKQDAIVTMGIARLEGKPWRGDGAKALAIGQGERLSGLSSRPSYTWLIEHLVYCVTGQRLGDHDASTMTRCAVQAGTPDHMLWQSLLAGRTSKEALTGLPADVEGPLHAMTNDQNLEAWTYQELVALHALHILVVNEAGCADGGDGGAGGAGRMRVQRAAVYHLHETQPDHATTEPWALAAFAGSVETRPFADQQLHVAMTQGDPLFCGLLLADAVALMRTSRFG